MDKFEYIDEKLARIDAWHRRRSPRIIESVDGPLVKFRGSDAPKILFCSNNYLNIAGDPAVDQAAKQAIDKYGTGTPSSRLISGTMSIHAEVERSFASFFGKESAILFTSGWTANQALMTCLPQSEDIVLLDKLDHASIIDGVKSAQTTFRTYRRDNIDRLEKYLADTRYRNKFIVTESVFSMDGDTADLKTLVELKNMYNAILIVDEAHAVGCMGPSAAGLADHFGLLDEIDIVVSPLGKAVGASGAVVAGQQKVIDYLVNTARPFIYTTASSPATSAAILAGLEIIKTQPERRQKLADNSNLMRKLLNDAGLNTGYGTSHIIPVIIGDSQKAMEVSESLFDKGFHVVAVRPPTVAPGTSRLRISMQTKHTEGHIKPFVKDLADLLSP